MTIKMDRGLPGRLTSSAAWSRRAPEACHSVHRLANTWQAVVLGFLGILASAPSPYAATLAERMRVGEPAALVDELASLGRTLDLAEPIFVRGAIGDVHDIPVSRDQRRDNWEPAFTRYQFPTGEITYNPDLGSQYFLLVRLHSCVPVQMIRERLQSPEFMQPASRITIALYTDTPYADRHLNAFTYYEGGSGCVASFGLAQWKYDPWHTN